MPAALKVRADQKFARKPGSEKPEAKILFQNYFKSVGPRTYAAQVKEGANGNHFILLTEGRRDESTGEVRKTKLIVFSEDFREFFKMLSQAAHFVRDNPVPEQVAKKRARFWEKKRTEGAPGRRGAQ
jgi:hypothetical protein